MPGLIDLKSLEQILITHSPKNPNYFLFMLGTDTEYTHIPTKNSEDPTRKKNYENGETLSYTARLISQQLGESDPVIKADQPLSYKSPSVAVINGPTTLGYEVGDRIAQAVILILNEIAQGKTNFQISGHSRGAVETLLISHELERIKNQMKQTPKKSFYQVLINSPCPLTKAAFQQGCSELNESQEIRDQLTERLDLIEINLFLIDPVPGGRFRGIPYTSWRDDRFYNKPPCNTSELLIVRDERTRCFIPIVPSDTPALSIPGHHGTATGNLYSQQHEPIPEIFREKNTSLVQQLVLCKLLNFLNKQTGIFTDEIIKVDLDHPELDPLSSEFIRAKPADRLKKLLALYQSVHENDDVYKHFASTAYPYLGTENTPAGHRYIHFRAHNYIGLDSVVPGLEGEFVNTEHAHLYLNAVMGFSMEEESDLVLAMTGLPIALMELFMSYINNNRQVQTLLNNETTRKNTFQAISLFIDSLSQRYLRNHLSIVDKTALLETLKTLFRGISDCKHQEDDAPINAIITDCEITLHMGVKKTAETHYESLLDQSNTLNDQLVYLLATTEDFSASFNGFILELNKYSEKDHPLSGLINDALTELSAINPIHIESVKPVFKAIVSALLTSDKEDTQKAAELILNCAMTHTPYLGSFLEDNLLNETKLLVDLNQLYEDINSLIEGKARINQLIGGLELNINSPLLKMHRERVLQLSAKFLVLKTFDLRSKPEGLSDDFFNLIKPLAITYGATNPLVETLMAEKQALQQKQSHQEGLIQQLLSTEELACAHLIETQLKPLTIDYWYHLITEAKRINPRVIPTDIDNSLPEIVDATSPEIELVYKNINEKFTALQALKHLLADTNTNPLPSKRIDLFSQKLKENDQQLKNHRDPTWYQYLKNCIAAIGLICTGIIPGAIALIAYSYLYDKSSPLFFTKSQGEEYTDKAQQLLNNPAVHPPVVAN